MHVTDPSPAKTHDADADAPPRRRLDPDARKAQLLQHAISAFAEGGIERAVHADVAQRAGVSTPTVFKYFPTREALVDAVLSQVEVKIFDLIKQVPNPTTLRREELMHEWALKLSALCETDPDIMKVLLSWSVAFSSIRGRYQAFENQKLAMMTSSMINPGPDKSDARILLGSAMLYIRLHFDGSPKDVRLRYADRMAQLVAAAPDY
ncbi:hypothetical protein GCM10011309_17590 [Litorimonas cladophorae]|uniref:HTH tetR-type domain-containing protein n=1 Tax=Litorimonas cladophorae TaxID=1220491 RepID=A0A918KMR9_9PROT|nr:TetR/AcrR family transcriptional regulator [Litorimonas cladophorae]GGX68295.1 hypothetical protein GCM10011309_17590 [Litorimonas cladophorae]